MRIVNELALKQLWGWSKLVSPDVLRRIPVDLERLGEFWGVHSVIERELDVAGMVRRLTNGQFVVLLRKDDVPGRKRFSWAHELGHILMANHDSPEIGCQKFGKFNKALERSCDVIATEILMPRGTFGTEAQSLGWRLKSALPLSATFDVTVQAATRRLVELIDEPAFFSVWRPQLDRKLKFSWAVPNDLGKPYRPEVRWQTNPQALWPIYEASSHKDVIDGGCKVLMKVNGETLYKEVQTEALSVGRGNHQSLLGLHYLTRPTVH